MNNYTLKSLFFLVLLSCGGFTSAQTIVLPYDSARTNPLKREGSVVGSQDYAVVYEYLSGSSLQLRAAVRRNLDSAATHFVESSADTFNIPGSPGGNRSLTSTTADVNGDGRDELVYAVQTGVNVELYCLYLNPNDSGYTYQMFSAPAVEYGVSGASNVDAPNYFGRVVVDKADLNQDGKAELILAYYEVFVGLRFVFLGEGSGQNLNMVGGHHITEVNDNGGLGEYWHFSTEDLDYDGFTEIIAAFSYDMNQSFLRVLEFNGSAPYILTQRSELDLIDDNNLTNTLLRVACVRSGDINGDLIPEIGIFTHNDVVGQRIIMYNIGDAPGGTTDYLSRILRLPITFPALSHAYDGYANSVINRIRPFDARIGDVNFDGIDDIVAADNRYILIFKGNPMIDSIVPSLTAPVELNELFMPPIPGPNVTDFLQLADLNRNGSKSILLSWNGFLSNTDLSWQLITTRYFTIVNDSTTLSSERIIRQTPFAFPNCAEAYRFATAAGDFSGDGYRLGLPTTTILQGVVQPLVILSAPPSHFDNVVAEDSLTNLSNCDGIICPSSVQYQIVNNQSVAIGSETKSDWSVGATAGVSVGIGVASVEAKLEASYGEGFSKKGTQTSTTTEATEIDSYFDDVVYYSSINYKVREFPLYKGEQYVGSVSSVHPMERNYYWQTARELDLFYPMHEPGNVLSFRNPELFLTQSDLNQQLYGTMNGFNLNSGVGYTWEVIFSELSVSEQSLQRDVSLSASLNGSVYGVEAGLSASFNMSDIATQSSSIGSDIRFFVNMPAFNAPGGSAYNVFPRLFWRNNGVAVIDYAVETSNSAGSNFWTTWYNKPDPALNLPWRLDVLRGVTNDETKTRQTKSVWITRHQSDEIVLNPQANDEIDVHVRVFNYGLQDINNANVSCFMGHPELDGESLPQLVSGSLTQTTGPIPSQGYKEIVFSTKLPSDTSLDGRLYVALNYGGPNNDEVHESNNLGFIEINGDFSQKPEDFGTGISGSPIDEKRMVAWPVPTSDKLQIYSNSLRNGLASLRLIDLNGHIVFQQESVIQKGQLQSELQVGGIKPGLYTLQVQQKGLMLNSRVLIQQQ